ncbi:MAG: SUMF1/EgtB/PvdO family nonheme iron enzyme [Stellaceae bacterium]
MSQNWAICIGIDRYDNLQSLQYAKRDAEALRDFFENEAGFDKVYFFAEDASPIPTDFGEPMRSMPSGGTLRRFLRVRFEQKFLKPSDNVWFFFAGHGRREKDRDYVMPIDADPGNVEETAIPVSYITERLRRCGAANVILLLDACRNEGARDGQGVGAETHSGVVTIASCSPSERSYEIAELQHGAFTYSLLEGLRLQGESNCATVERLDLHLRVRVPELCAKHRKPRQTPYTHAEPLEKLHLILVPKFAALSDLGPIKLDALQAETNGDLETAEQLWWRVMAVSPIDAQAHEAIKRIALKQSALSNSGSPSVSEAPSTRQSSLPRQHFSRTIRLTRRQTIGIGALVAAGAGAVIAAPSIRKWVSRPSLRTIAFDVVTVDDKGARNPPEKYRAAAFTEAVGSSAGVNMVSIPAGSFTMGSPADEPERQPNEGPQHHVTVASFFCSDGPITQAQWSAVVSAHPDRIHRELDPNPSFFRGIDLPIESITWNQAEEFCLRLAAITGRPYRLASEAEWEYACRAGTTTPFNFGPTITPELVNYCGTGEAVCGDSDGRSVASHVYYGQKYSSGAYGQGPPGIFRGTTTRAGTFPPNRFGLYDMHGNVWEYCLDKVTPNYADVPRDGTANLLGPEDSERMLRGGSWSHNPAICRSAYRDSIAPGDRGLQGRIGFRVVCTL